MLLALEELFHHGDGDGGPGPPVPVVLCTLLWGQRLAKYLRFQVRRLNAFGSSALLGQGQGKVNMGGAKFKCVVVVCDVR